MLSSVDARDDEKRSEKLWLEILSLLDEAGLTIGQVDLFAVCIGPGGFTGLRVGTAALKGFAVALGRPIVGVTSLEAAAFGAGRAPAVCAMVNAYKGEVYSQLFSFDDEGVPVAQNDPMVSTVEKSLERVADLNELILTGDGVPSAGEVIAARGEGNWVIRQSDHSAAEDIAGLAFLRYSRGEAQPAASLAACYVRPAEAEIKLSLGLLGSKIKRNMRS